jgi:hypothetical protein
MNSNSNASSEIIQQQAKKNVKPVDQEDEEEKEYCKKTPSLPILINRMLQIRFENYSVSHYENCSRTNQDMQKLKHSLSHMNFSNMIELTDHLELENDDYDNFPKTKKEPPPSDYFLAL